jgi:hypothetical protein
MIKNQDNLQYVSALLLTHSKLIKIVKENFNELINLFNLSEKNLKLMKNFIKHNYKNILINAMICEEKRWRECLNCIKYTDKIMPINKLKDHWYLYLESYPTHQAIPKTPLEESIKFMNFLLMNKFDELIYTIIEYELMRNTTYLFEFINLNYSRKKFDIKRQEACWIQLNPSFTYKKFNINVNRILLQIQNKQKFTSYQLKEEYIGFFKNPKDNIVKTFQLSENIKELLLNIKRMTKINIWINTLLMGGRKTFEEAINITIKLYELGVILIEDKENQMYV